MRVFASLILCATLPFAAGFALSSPASAQGMQYDGPGAMSGGSAMPNPLPVQAAPLQPMASQVAPQVTAQGATPALMSGAAMDMTRMDALEQQVRDLTNQIEQRDFQFRQLRAEYDKYVAATDQRLQALERAAVSAGNPPAAPASGAASDLPPQPAPTAPQATPQSAPQPGTSGSLVDPNGAYRPASTPQLGQIREQQAGGNGGATTSGTPQGTPASPAKAYDQAFSYLQQSDYQDAQRAFSDFLKTYPTHPLAANAQYWLGESYFAQTQYSQAAKTFAKAFQEHPQGQKAPDALLKLSITLDKMNKRSDACLTLGELSKRFPGGPASVLRRGQEESTRMNCTAAPAAAPAG
ncbi:MAG: tol-pal system protein YbgF [Alphaproteobacteria bacterium]|nr:tol-pal system protein YbgF [Alphaproteobacteria bacterium]USO07185.1 MAG: tol-pal system protein YbgF [Rhodospirillales bacterium]